MAAGIPFMKETGRKAVQNGGRSNSKNDHGFWPLFVTFERKHSLLLLLTSNLSFSCSFKLHNKICLLAFRSPLKQFPKICEKCGLIFQNSGYCSCFWPRGSGYSSSFCGARFNGFTRAEKVRPTYKRPGFTLRSYNSIEPMQAKVHFFYG